MSVLANYSLIFTQLLSTLDAWVGSNTLMTLFILIQPSWREAVLLDGMLPFFQFSWSPLLTQEGTGTEISESQGNHFCNSVCIKYFLYVSTKAHYCNFHMIIAANDYISSSDHVEN